MSAPDELQALADSLRPRVMSTEERVSYRDKLVQALKLAFAALMGNKDTTTAGPLTYENLADAALAVRDVELDRLSQENDRLTAEVDRVAAVSDRWQFYAMDPQTRRFQNEIRTALYPPPGDLPEPNRSRT